jgi:hypothetical protein
LILTLSVTPLMTRTLQEMSDDECEVVFAINETEEQIARNIVRMIQQEREQQPPPSAPHMTEDTFEERQGVPGTLSH